MGAIIGRGGRTILSIQQEAKRRSLGHDMGVRIHVVGGISNSNTNATSHSDGGAALSSGAATWNYNEYQQQQQQQSAPQDESGDVDDWVPVTIRGDPIGCLEACRLIIPLVDRPQDPTYLTIVFDIPVHRAKHNLLVGKAGILLACLSATYETRLMIPPNELMSNVESTGNIWEQRQQQQQHSKNDAGSAMLFDVGGAGGAGSSNMMSQSGGLNSNIIQLEGEIDNVEQCLVKILGIIASEDNIVPSGIICDCDTASTNPLSTTPTKKPTGGDSSKVSPAEKTVAEAIIIVNAGIPSKSWKLVQRKTNTKILRKSIRDDAEPSLVNDIDDIEEEEEDDDDNDDVTKEEAAASRPRTKFIITGKNEQSVQKACVQLEKLLGLEVGSTEITVKVVSVETSPMSKGDDQPDGEGATSGKKIRKRRAKKKATQ